MIALHSETRAEFYLADMGIMTAGCQAAALYTSYTAAELVQTLREVVQLQHPESATLIEKILRREEQDSALRLEAARQLANVNDAKLTATVLGFWSKYPKELHADLANSLASRKDGAKALLTAMKMLAGKPLPATSPTMKNKRSPSSLKKS